MKFQKEEKFFSEQASRRFCGAIETFQTLAMTQILPFQLNRFVALCVKFGTINRTYISL